MQQLHDCSTPPFTSVSKLVEGEPLFRCFVAIIRRLLQSPITGPSRGGYPEI